MDFYILLLLVFGLVVLLTAWLPMVLRELPLSLPILCIALGAGLSWSVLSPIMPANPLENGYLTQRLTEFVVIVALVGAGLKIDRPVGLEKLDPGLEAARRGDAVDDRRHRFPGLEPAQPRHRFGHLAGRGFSAD